MLARHGCAHTHIHIHIHTYTHTRIRTYIQPYTQYTHAHTPVRLAHIRTHTPPPLPHAHTHIHTRTHTYTRTYTHTHAHTPSRSVCRHSEISRWFTAVLFARWLAVVDNAHTPNTHTLIHPYAWPTYARTHTHTHTHTHTPSRSLCRHSEISRWFTAVLFARWLAVVDNAQPRHQRCARYFYYLCTRSHAGGLVTLHTPG